MPDLDLPAPHWSAPLTSLWWRFAASGRVPATWYLKTLPTLDQRAARTGKLKLEIVSHCWKYSNLLAYQLSSLVLNPPEKLSVVMTVFYCEEDEATVELLRYFGAKKLQNVTWNWRPLSRQQLFRRGIGRNLAARETDCDWVWFTDCDLVFHGDCLDQLAKALQGRQDALLFPAIENTTNMLAEDDPMLVAGAKPQVLAISTDNFSSHTRDRATGPLQITHGDVARSCGYCECIELYQTPSELWCKAREDRAFRWLLQTQGTAIDLSGVFRIRHLHKGRYTGNSLSNKWRSLVRRVSSRIKGEEK